MNPIEQAIAAAEQTEVPMLGTTVTISSTGRPVQIQVPVGLTLAEMNELVGWMYVTLLPAAQQPAGGAQRPVAVLDTPRGPVRVQRPS